MSPGELRDQIRRPQFRRSDTPAPRSGDGAGFTPPPQPSGSTRTLLASVLAYLKRPALVRQRRQPPAAAGLDPAAHAAATTPGATVRPAQDSLAPRILLHWRFQSTARTTFRLAGAPARQTQQTRAPGASSVNSNLGP